MPQQTMKCIEISEPGAPEVLQMAERARPELADGEVLIKVAAAGVNRPDVIQRKGLYPPPPGASDLLGLEVAGEIVAVCGDVAGLSVGDKVCALTNGGGYAQYCNVPAQQCLPIPAGLSMEEAAIVPETFFTVWFNLFVQGGLKEGQSLLVHGGSSGIGTTAIQVATVLGAKVYTTAGSEEKCEACRKLGAVMAINYKEADFVDVIKEATGGKGVNMILDMVGGDYIARNIRCLARKGRLINIAYLQGSKAEVNFMSVMMKQLQITGSTLRQQPLAVKAQIAEELQETVWPLLEKGAVKPVLHSSFEMDQAKESHELMESSQHIGKIVLKVES
ncbi:Quinone oxidoreductase [Candidatus Terasakiella magnetica]|uniref:Quinone oxidoreductase n=1 Tax=Candidatus Terasakiella magnetica TaxID=1867952 RepID=A0A1C3RL95_9PROT|nr:NAD(P)H-quinone oxidoreductase [Candidatus Terasakiella magnetica]SCA58027.1 Quinone oxidoreductase [Candidatus Terasakiella magnetica]